MENIESQSLESIPATTKRSTSTSTTRDVTDAEVLVREYSGSVLFSANLSSYLRLEVIEGQFARYVKLTKILYRDNLNDPERLSWTNLSIWSWTKIVDTAKELLTLAKNGGEGAIKVKSDTQLKVSVWEGHNYIGIHIKKSGFEKHLWLSIDQWEKLMSHMDEVLLVLTSSEDIHPSGPHLPLPQLDGSTNSATQIVKKRGKKRRKTTVKWPETLTYWKLTNTKRGDDKVLYVFTEKHMLAERGNSACVEKRTVSLMTNHDLSLLCVRLLCMQKSAEVLTVVRANCEGCTLDAPSQIDHDCMMASTRMSEYSTEIGEKLTESICVNALSGVYEIMRLPFDSSVVINVCLKENVYDFTSVSDECEFTTLLTVLLSDE